jgi:hypothetical protein
MARKKRNDGEVAVKEISGVPAELVEEMAADAGDGQQGVTTDDLAIPFLRILQQMSPQIMKRDGAYIEGAQEGDIFNTVTGQIWSEGDELIVVPCSFNFKVIEWWPRDSGEGDGIVDTYSREDNLPDSELNDRRKAMTNKGTILEDTAEHYVLIIDMANMTCEQALMSMSSTQLKHSRKWNSLISQQVLKTSTGIVKAPSYSRMYNLKTRGESKDENNWSGWDITLHGPVEDLELYRAAKVFSSSVNAGNVIVKHTQDEAPSAKEGVM